LFQSINEFKQQLLDIRRRTLENSLSNSLINTIEQRLNDMERVSFVLNENAVQTCTTIETIRNKCEQLIIEMKRMSQWLKLAEQLYNRCLPTNLSTANEKSDAARQLHVTDSY
jgi:Zn-dependent oligopeptidase